MTAVAVSGVDHLQVGDEVWGCAGGFHGLPSGALAEKMLTDAQLVSKKPSNLSFIEAQNYLPLVSLTAWFALADRAQVKAGDKILIHAGGGGVGHVVGIQIAKHLGGIAHTTVSNEQKAGYARELGASETIIYGGLSVEDYVNQHADGKGYDIVFDTGAGGDNLDASFEAARFGGIVNIVSIDQHNLGPMHAKSLTLHVVFLVGQVANPINCHTIKPRLDTLCKMAEDGELRPLIDQQQFQFEDVADAHAYLESGEHRQSCSHPVTCRLTQSNV